MELIRINRIIDMADPEETIADIGTDHGFTALLLLERNKAKKVIATDISAKSLSKAEALFSEKGMKERTETRTGAGLSVLSKGEADAAVISGMGGVLIGSILEADIETVREMDYLLLSPQSNIPEFRMKLNELGIGTSEEEAVCESGRHYVIIKAGSGNGSLYTEDEYLTGKAGNIKDRGAYKAYIRHLIEKNDEMLKRFSLSEKRKKELVHEQEVYTKFELSL